MGDIVLLHCHGVLELTVIPVPVQVGPCRRNSARRRAASLCASVGACPRLGGTEVTQCAGRWVQPPPTPKTGLCTAALSQAGTAEPASGHRELQVA